MLCSFPQASKPSQADWLNERSSTPPISVTIATLCAASVLPSAEPPPVESVEPDFPPLPHAPSSVNPATATIPKLNNFAFFIAVKPPIK